MLQCPKCSSNSLSVTECKETCCSPFLTKGCRSWNSQPPNMMSGGVIQYPSTSSIKPFHMYQNTGSPVQTKALVQDTVSGDGRVKNFGSFVDNEGLSSTLGPCVTSSAGLGSQSCARGLGPPVPPSDGSVSSADQLLLEGRKLQEKQIMMNEQLLQLQIEMLHNQLQQSRLQHQIRRNNCSTEAASFLSPLPTPSILVGGPTPSPFSSAFSSWPTQTPPDHDSILASCRQQLKQSGWYYGPLSWQVSSSLLLNTSPGTFLVRDSQHPGCHFALSFQRGSEGPTSIRIQFQGGKFFLDAEEQIKHAMPRFNSVGKLVQHYLTRDVNHQDQGASPMVLRRPLYNTPPSLSHLARLTINSQLQGGKKGSESEEGSLGSLELPSKLVDFLKTYPLSI